MTLRILLFVLGIIFVRTPLHAADRPTAAEILKIQWVNPPADAPAGITHHTFHSQSMNVQVGYNM